MKEKNIVQVFQDPATGNYYREDGKPGYRCIRCGSGYATAATRDDTDAHGCAGLSLDLSALADAKGLFEQGYDAEDVAALGTSLRTVQFLCVWAYRDALGFGGDSEIVGREVHPDDSTGPWRPLDATFARYLYQAEAAVRIEDVPALLASEEYPVQDFETRSTYTGTNVAEEDRVTP